MSHATNPSQSGMPGSKLIKIRLALKGRPVQSYTFDKDVITVGRSPDCDIVLDNAGVSRNHVRIVQTPGGYYEVEDLGSSNGTFVNDTQVQREYLMNNDVVRVGKFTMWVNYETDRRESPANLHRPDPGAYSSTTVLSTNEIQSMMEKERDLKPDLRVVGNPQPARGSSPSHEMLGMVALVALVTGAVIGAGAAWIILR